MKVLICLLIGAISAGAQGVQPQIADNAAPAAAEGGIRKPVRCLMR